MSAIAVSAAMRARIDRLIVRRWRALTVAAIVVPVVVLAARHGVPDVLVTLLLVAPCAIVWSMTADHPRRGLLVAGLLLLVFCVLYGWSQLRPDGVAPPLYEWDLACFLTGAAIVVVAGRRQRRHPAPSFPPLRFPGQRTHRPPRHRTAFGLLALPLILGVCCCFPASRGEGLEADLLASHANTREALPPPDRTRLVQTGCFGSWSHGLCSTVFTVAATDGVPREALVDRLAAHYRQRGWPLKRDAYRHYGCRPVRGILAWRPHCMSIELDPENESGMDQPRIPGTVNVFIG